MLIILDRDGVINEDSPAYIKSPEEWLPIPGSLEAIAQLKAKGFTVVVATNQSGIGRGLYNEETLNEIHQKMMTALAQLETTLDGIVYCPHHPKDNCFCRKPKPGMLLQIGKHFNQDLKYAICIGDSLRDLLAAENVGAKPILVLTGNGHQTRNIVRDIPVYNNLKAAAESLCATTI